MKTVFVAANHVEVPDGTLVSAFLNPFDNAGGAAPATGATGVSLAEGRLLPGVRSAVHVLPLVTQITYVLEGRVTVAMQDRPDDTPYQLELRAGQAATTRPGELLQLRNPADSPARVLYVCTPAYVYEVTDAGEVAYDDALTLGSSWESARGRAAALTASALEARSRQRAAAVARLAGRAQG